MLHQRFAIAIGSRLLQIPFQIRKNSAKPRLNGLRTSLSDRFTVLFLLPIEQQILLFLRQLFKRQTQIDFMRLRRNVNHMDQIRRRRPRPQPAVQQRLRPIVNDLGWIEIKLTAQAMAFRTRSIHAVKRKRSRFQLRNANPAIRASQLRRIQLLFPTNDGNLHQAFRQLHRQGNAGFQTRLNPGFHQQAVHNNLDGMVLALVELKIVFQADDFAVHARPSEALLHQLLHLLLELAFAPANDGRQNHHAIFRLESEHSAHNLVGGLTGNLTPAVRAMRYANRGV